MLRSLFSGISGLKNHQAGLDVIGTNLANVNTTGYKGSRLTFKDILSQTLKVAAAPSTDTGVGGVNPIQVGLGMSVASIDSIMSQGNLQVTSNFTDLALQGEGFFSLSDGRQSYYTRAGTFTFDADGFLVSTANSYKVQGYNATSGVMGTTIEGIQIPQGIILPASATSSFEIIGNLDASDEQIGSILNTDLMLAIEDGTNEINGLYAGQNGGSGSLDDFISGMTSGQTTITISHTGGTVDQTETFTYKTGTLSSDEFNALSNGTNGLVERINAAFGGAIVATLDPATGAIEFENGDTVAADIAVTCTNSMFDTALSGLEANYASGATNLSDEFSHRATSTDTLASLRNSAGESLAIATTDIITISANIGGSSTATTATMTVGAGDTLADLADTVQTTFGITNSDNVEITSNGEFQVTGDGGTSYSIENLSITATDAALATRSVWNGVFEGTGTNWSSQQTAQDNHRIEILVYDENGSPHALTLAANIRSSSGGLIQWAWDATSTDSESGVADTVSPATGTITFNSDGSLSSFSPSTITITPSGVASAFTIDLAAGTSNQHDGLVCFDGSATAVAQNQNGYAAGELDSVSIDQTGLVVGTFTNGRNLDLAQILVTRFDNPSGLERAGDNMWKETRNSGLPNPGTPGEGGRAVVLTSTLEMSNVDLSSEFTNMIVMQRGFQANASTISTSDEILQELVRLKR